MTNSQEWREAYLKNWDPWVYRGHFYIKEDNTLSAKCHFFYTFVMSFLKINDNLQKQLLLVPEDSDNIDCTIPHSLGGRFKSMSAGQKKLMADVLPLYQHAPMEKKLLYSRKETL